MIKTISNIISDLLDLVFPRVCFSCLEEAAPQQGSIFCIKCMFEIPYTDHFENAENDLVKLFYGKGNIKHAAALMFFTEGGVVQNILHNFKYKKMLEIGTQLGHVVGDKVLNSKYFENIDVIIPVPLHKDKQYKRGFNQSEVFGNAIATKLKRPLLNNVLIRNKFTETQTRKSKSERKENVSDAFNVKDHSKIVAKHVLLVDDVITTGSTILACAETIRENGASSISIISIAKAIN